MNLYGVVSEIFNSKHQSFNYYPSTVYLSVYLPIHPLITSMSTGTRSSSRSSAKKPARVRLRVCFRTSRAPSPQIVKADLVDLYHVTNDAKAITIATPFDDITEILEDYVDSNNQEIGHFLFNQELNLSAHPQCIFGREKKLKNKESSKPKETKLVAVENTTRSGTTSNKKSKRQLYEK